jgi:hypothetical protein
MLRLVHPAPKGQEKRTSTVPKMGLGRKCAALVPTIEEQKHIRAAIRNLAYAFGGFDVLSEVTGVPLGTLRHANQSASFALAVIVARAARIPVEQLLSGRPHEVGACALCGRKGAK